MAHIVQILNWVHGLTWGILHLPIMWMHTYTEGLTISILPQEILPVRKIRESYNRYFAACREQFR